MKYREGTIPKTLGQLRDRIGDTMLRAPRRNFSEGRDFDGAFHSIESGIENLRARFGNTKANQLLDIVRQAKKHYETGGLHKPGTEANTENRLAGALMEDTKMLVMDRQPWAYPKELYRWPLNPWLPELSEADLLNKDLDSDMGR
jgi:hypothetical protein